jgi:hypothetical protein
VCVEFLPCGSYWFRGYTKPLLACSFRVFLRMLPKPGERVEPYPTEVTSLQDSSFQAIGLCRDSEVIKLIQIIGPEYPLQLYSLTFPLTAITCSMLRSVRAPASSCLALGPARFHSAWRGSKSLRGHIGGSSPGSVTALHTSTSTSVIAWLYLSSVTTAWWPSVPLGRDSVR